MKETIYTIPVSEAYEQDCECPLCYLQNKLENEYAEYTLGASLMEPDSRKLTNAKGFCKEHFELIYNKGINKLGLALIIDTHMMTHNKKIANITGLTSDYVDTNKPLTDEDEVTKTMSLAKGVAALFRKDKSKTKNSDEASGGTRASSIDRIIDYIDEYEHECFICDKLNYTMNRYIDVIYYLYFSEKDFKARFNSGNGYCLPHLRDMLLYAKKLSGDKREEVVNVMLNMQVTNMDRVQKDIDWFTKKFDYRYESEPWGNSRDAIPRSIKKLMGPCKFK